MSEEPEKIIVAPVKVQAPVGSPPAPAQVGDANIAPRTTAEEDTATSSQRHINRVWEYTQATLAILVTGFTLYVAANLAMREKAFEGAFLLLSNAFFVVVTTYLTRTNHTKTGGVQKGDTGR